MAEDSKQEWLNLLLEASRQLSRLSGNPWSVNPWSVNPWSVNQRWQGELSRLYQRLSLNQYQVAVFGAFSAGKSSLINALLGDALLVVSPNPTTAAVTHIQRLDDKAAELLKSSPTSMTATGASADLRCLASVTAKTEAEVWADVQQAFASLHLSVANLEEAVAAAASLKPTDFAATARKSVTFLRSFAAGYEAMRARLGTSWQVNQDDLARLTANEQFASFVNEVHIQHPAEVLRQGVSLVDTPGVNSIHRRHTDVAFRYMRQADAIIFVLYYTHAFSRADKDFLLQLAGVQDVVGADKLLVVINAVDLAKSEEESQAVAQRVDTELRQLGIRRPRVFQVSSQVALAAEQVLRGNDDSRLVTLLRQRLHVETEAELHLQRVLVNSGIPNFRSALVQQVAEQSEELSRQAARQALQDMARRIHQQWQVERDEMERDETALEAVKQVRQEWLMKYTGWRTQVAAGEEPLQQSLGTEWKELIFHAGERIRMRFGSLVREAFHPGRLRAGTSRPALADAGLELRTMLSRQIELECRTFALRASKQADDAVRTFTAELGKELLALHVIPDDATVTLADGSELDEIWFRAELNEKPLLAAYRHFSNPKQFFEENGQRAMLLDLEESLLPEVRRELERLAARVAAQALAEVQSAQDNLLVQAHEQVREATLGTQGRLTEKQFAECTDVVDWFHHLPL